uniref:Uncharacterized protein n=1 Tax=Lotharella vacuolata TaxID=74820 RepID=A0A0H5BH93_9EUKA|nr:hypothetical protein [Lotharella vacuolata]
MFQFFFVLFSKFKKLSFNNSIKKKYIKKRLRLYIKNYFFFHLETKIFIINNNFCILPTKTVIKKLYFFNKIIYQLISLNFFKLTKRFTLNEDHIDKIFSKKIRLLYKIIVMQGFIEESESIKKMTKISNKRFSKKN